MMDVCEILIIVEKVLKCPRHICRVLVVTYLWFCAIEAIYVRPLFVIEATITRLTELATEVGTPTESLQRSIDMTEVNFCIRAKVETIVAIFVGRMRNVGSDVVTCLTVGRTNKICTIKVVSRNPRHGVHCQTIRVFSNSIFEVANDTIVLNRV